jgi:S-DNA-T family DNA segregation ATPase FtsK/SpoIIIE
MVKEKGIEVRYKKIRREEPPKQVLEEDSTDKLRNEIIEKYQRLLRIASILLVVIFLFVIISILSFSPSDEFIADFSFRDFISALFGKEEILSKFRQVSNLLGPVGAWVSYFFVIKTIGYFSLVFPILIVVWSIKLLVTQKFYGRLVNWTIVSLLFAFTASAFIGSINNLFQISIPYYWVGSVGVFLSTFVSEFLGKVGAFLLYFASIILLVIFSFDIKIESFILRVWENFKNYLHKSKEKKPDQEVAENINSQPKENLAKGDQLINETFVKTDDKETAQILIRSFSEDQGLSIEDETKHFPKITPESESVAGAEFQYDNEPEINDEEFQDEFPESEPNEDFGHNSKLVVIVEEKDEDGLEDDDKSSAFTPISTLTLDEKINYSPPPIDLLIDDESKFQINEDELKQNAKLLQEKLETFKIYIENVTVTPGPVVTQYEFVPAPGIKISRIQSLADDIALGLKARGIRIIAPVPGKGTVGIEIPNQKPLVVRFGNCLKNAKIKPNYQLPIILGKTISGEVFVEDLARMPHLLIAGATGSGKSVGINTIIASLIYKMHPQNLKFVIIDPKKVELTHYQQLLYHFLAVSPEIEDAIVTEPSDAVLVLKALIAEMQNRYDILASVHQKNIFEYNKKVREGLFRKDTEFVHRPMPYIVTIIDELADLMLTVGKEIEALIIRLAQLARAVGIHLVVATQRPSVDIITGLIKANFPARIAYLVASRVDSRTIIDTIGAEQLLGNGDMLFLPSGWPSPIRIQNAFLTTEEIERICDYIGNQKGYSKPYYLPKVEDGKSSKETFDREGFDPLFEDAARLIIRHQQASVSMLQRRLKIGYNRAGRIMDELEIAGIVGPFDGSKGRTIKIATEEELDKFLREKGL